MARGGRAFVRGELAEGGGDGAAQGVGGPGGGSEQALALAESEFDGVQVGAAGRPECARPRAGGGRLTEGALGQGYFVPPMMFADVRGGMRIAREEISGPVISAISFKDVEEVTERGNRTNVGFGSGVWTRDVSKAHRVARGPCVGSVWANCYQAVDPAMPFGGYKVSGYGRESGPEHVGEYRNTVSVS